MFRRSRADTFHLYGKRPSRWPLPRWLTLLLLGTAAGAAGLWALQERYLPPRLTVQASAQLRSACEQADADRNRLQAERDQAQQSLQAALAQSRGLGQDLAASRAALQRLQGDLAAVVAALPPDPRAGTVAVRAARFAARGGMLAYEVVLSRDGARGQPLAGQMHLVLSGASARRGADTVTLKPVALSLGGHEVLRGSLPLPEGFRPQQATVQIVDQPAGRLLGTRLLLVRGGEG